jgi:membrane protein
VPLLAGGVAFFAFLALFPAIIALIALISLVGLVVDPASLPGRRRRPAGRRGHTGRHLSHVVTRSARQST